ncbi:thiamine diphosphokinase [Marimonas sp. MJW-29]|uniref:Thiamine diphosphokinase n=1 Tax=Sulfitobacter sediminis TaxID=3234186 RepID=A0ABV3RIZ0_9RHOB
MTDPIVHSETPVTLVGAGDATPEDLQNSLTLAPTCVAADGGAALCLSARAEIAAVIGDFDSISAETLAQIPPERHFEITEQVSTDFEKALIRIAAPLVLGVGFLGGRIDHQLAVFHALSAFPERRCLLLGHEEVVCLAPPRIELPMQPGERVSLFPMAAVTGHSEGLHWPIEGLDFAPASRIGTSNRALGPVSLSFGSPDMLLILPRRLMPALVARLSPPDAARWPARAG